MGTLFVKASKARASAGKDLGWASDHAHSTTKAAIVFWKHPKTGYFVKDDNWPLIFFGSTCYEGELGYAGIIDTPWLHDLVATSCHAAPQGIFDALVDPPTMRLQAFCRAHGYTAKFTTQVDRKRGDLVLAEISK